MSAPIQTRQYHFLNKDPTDRLTRKVFEKLLTRPRPKDPPSIYEDPGDLPLIRIVTFVNSIACDLSFFLANILSRLFSRYLGLQGDQLSSLLIHHQQ